MRTWSKILQLIIFARPHHGFDGPRPHLQLVHFQFLLHNSPITAGRMILNLLHPFFLSTRAIGRRRSILATSTVAALLVFHWRWVESIVAQIITIVIVGFVGALDLFRLRICTQMCNSKISLIFIIYNRYNFGARLHFRINLTIVKIKEWNYHSISK